MEKSFLLACFFLLGALSAVNCVPTITVSKSFIQHAENVTVMWIGVHNASTDDVIALFVPPPLAGDPLNTSVRQAPGNTIGAGSFTLQLVNMRLPFQFVYYQPSSSSPAGFAAVASSPVINVDMMEPMQGHLALTGDITQMRVIWVTGENATGVVQYGTARGEYNYTVNAGPAYTYTPDQMCANSNAQFFYRFPGYFSDAIMTNLTPSTRYYYRYGVTNHWSAEHSFVAAPETSPDTPVSVIAYADMGTNQCEGMKGWCTPGPGAVTSMLQNHLTDADLLLHIGDIAYAVGHPNRWDQFFYQIENISTSLPYMVGIGNHETDWIDGGFFWASNDSGGECGIPYHARFNMPNAPAFSMSEKASPDAIFYYSYDFGPIHFVFMSTEHDFLEGSPQYEWIEKEFASIDRSRTPWLVFGGHRPLYVSTYSEGEFGDQQVSEKMRQAFEPLLYQYKVDLALWGHVHLYERTCPMFQFTCMGNYTAPGGTVHVVIGMAGAWPSNNTVEPQPYWSEYREVPVDPATMFGYTRITVTNSTALHFQLFTSGDVVSDDFWIINEEHAEFIEEKKRKQMINIVDF